MTHHEASSRSDADQAAVRAADVASDQEGGGGSDACQSALCTTLRWGAYGALFGVCFPIVAFLIRYFQFHDGAFAVWMSDPLSWIIMTAPLFLGLFAAAGGRQHGSLIELSLVLEDRVKERTRDLLVARDDARRAQANTAELLDNMGQAILAFGPDLRVEGEHSREADVLFGAGLGGARRGGMSVSRPFTATVARFPSCSAHPEAPSTSRLTVSPNGREASRQARSAMRSSRSPTASRRRSTSLRFTVV